MSADHGPDDARQAESLAAVLKVFAILQALSERNESGISELSVRLAMPKATVCRGFADHENAGHVLTRRPPAPLHCTAIGKLLMAWDHTARRGSILKGCDFKRYREKTITTRADCDVELQRTLDQGFGQDREEFDDHIRCAAIPIFDRLNQAVAGTSVSFPSFRDDLAREPQRVTALRDASRDISRQLGCMAFPLDPLAPPRR